MEEAVEYCLQCTRSAVASAKTSVTPYTTMVQEWFDVEHVTAGEAAANEAIRAQIEQLSELEAERARWRQGTLDRELRRYKATQAAVQEEAAPALKAIDDTDMSCFVYDDLLDTARGHLADVERSAAGETTSYGYESKMLVSLNVTAEALRRRLRAPEGGLPFGPELRALQQELTDGADVEAVAAPLEPSATLGLPGRAEVLQSARAVAATIEAARLEAAKYSPVGTPLTMLKFATPLDPAVVQRRAEDARLDRFVGRAEAADYGAAISIAGAVSAAHPEPEVTAAVDGFCDAARQRLAAQSLDRYVAAVVATQRHSLVVNLFKDQQQAAGKGN